MTYNTNNSTGGTTPPTQTAESNSETYAFVTPTADQYGLVRASYGFAGWSENPNTTTVQYAPGSTIELSSTNPSKTLYAVWQPGLMLITNMQEITTAGCKGGTNIGDTKQLIDSRDNKSYWVAKLADGNCWMAQNLDYNVPNSTRVTSTGGASGGPSSGDWKNDSTVRQYWDPGEKVISGNTLVNAGNTDRHLLVGNYYSWLSATDSTGSSVTADGVDASGSICPEGWKLPLSGSKNGLSANAASDSFGLMLNKQNIANNVAGSTAIQASPLYYLYGGFVANSSLYDASSRGYYWSSTSYNAGNAYNLYFISGGVNPSSASDRYRGLPVRCVAR